MSGHGTGDAARDFIGINWGSSNCRAWLLRGDGQVVEAWSEPKGIAGLDRAGMQALVASLRQRWPSASRVYACGMVGSNIGWAEVAYAQCPIGLEGLAAGLHTAAIGEDQMRIVPGLACRREDGSPDIMRGEETELFGLMQAGRLPQDGVVGLPGTHTKWVRLREGKVVEFITAMSGEIFDRLTAAGLLASIVGAPAQPGVRFDEGVAQGAGGRPGLGTLLFGARARVIRGDLARDEAASYLRGLLIGSEIADALAMYPEAAGGEITLVGAGPVCEMYAAALSGMGIASRSVDAREASVLGFSALHAMALQADTGTVGA
ncbi:MAG TPA: 2-dehydro-3-deoxygalactonokinase [Stenotrophomonas sp.]|jgi:2-dehydro-3-deoxygalactonokinase